MVVKTADIEFFCYHRDRLGSAPLRENLLEEHWSYMDRYATTMIARGPTFASDGDTPTGSVHILDLPDPATARAFAFDEPNFQAGVYRDVLLRRWRNTLGRTMWDFPGGRTGGNRFLVLGLGSGPAADLAVPPNRNELIAYGPLPAKLAGVETTRERFTGGGQKTTARLYGTRPECGPGRPEPGPLRGRRGPQLAIRRAAVIFPLGQRIGHPIQKMESSGYGSPHLTDHPRS